ncbi:MAG: FG-GAP-like repeat-containing protein [Planctomycetota bacterium]|nr:FG-GAP-like repeat-containing protein [Planctomycetota bacterium]MDG2142974.1 FG-GAP-like repeat-containing protein [Planctomycetota bacterium]
MFPSYLRFSSLGLIASSFFLAPAAAQQLEYTPGTFTNPKRWTEGVECADVDNDGDLDVFFAEGDGFASAGAKRQNLLMINKFEVTPFTFANESVARLGVHSSNAKSVDTGDVDGDGYVDAMFANAFNTDRPFLYMNVGSTQPGFFSFEGSARGFTTNYSSASSNFADLDNDGDLDVIISDSGNSFLGGSGDRPHLYFNDGNGFFTEDAVALNAPIKKAHMDVQFADVDGDWDLDFLGLNRATTHFLLLNDGAGNFTNASSTIPNTSSNVYEAEVGDLDGDTDIDMFFVSLAGFDEGPMYNSLAQSGTMGWTKGADSGSSDDNEIVLFDYDNDGDFDSLVGSLGSREKVMRNNGNGIFNIVNGVITTVGDPTLDMTVADLNNDGRYDVITTNGEGQSQNTWDSKLYTNKGSRDILSPVVVRQEEVVSGSTGPWIIRSEIRDQVIDDGLHYVKAELDYVVRTGPMTADVNAQNLLFTPAALTIAAGTTVTWTNNDGSAFHTVTSSTPDYDFDSGLFGPGQTFSHTFVRPGTYDYICTPHVGFGMVGTVTVTAGTSTTSGVTDMGAGGMFRFQMEDTVSGATDVVYERRFTDSARNVTVTDVVIVPVTGSGTGGSFTVYGTGASAANYMSIAGVGGPNIGDNFSVVTSGVTVAGVLQLTSLVQTNTPAFGGIMLADFTSPLLALNFFPAVGGVSTFNAFVPNNPVLVGLDVYFQSGFPDAGLPGGVALSDGLHLKVGL